MPLLEIWKVTRDSILKMNLEAIVRIAGDGNLKDNSETSIEFRTFLTEVEAEKLGEYATYCLEHSFTNSGQVLQDVINEIGRRLGFSAENGRYQGVRNDIGYDGIWRTNKCTLIIEVKTTDAYTIKLDVIAGYRDKLIDLDRVPKDSPILLVIGRSDTQSLEAQVRGSKHAWSMRIIGIDALIKLMEVNLSSSSNEVTEKIHTILQPIEYTRIDKIVDVIFTAAEDKINEIDEFEITENIDSNKESSSQNRTPIETINQRKDEIIRKFSEKLQSVLVKRKNSLYADQSEEIHVVVSISKQYQKSETFYWYAYHDETQRSFLKDSNLGFMLFGMTDSNNAFAVPYAILEEYWYEFYGTIKKTGKLYKHIFIYKTDRGFFIRVGAKGEAEINLSKYMI